MRMETVLSVVLILAVFAVLAQLGLRVVIRYALDETELRVRLVGLTVVRVPYEQIEEVGTAGFWDILFPRTRAAFNGIRAGNRIFFREAVIVKRASGVRRFVILTPDAAPTFAEELRARASRAKPSSRDSRRRG